MYPKLKIYRDKIAHNVRELNRLCGEYGISITGISKVFTGDAEIARIYVENGITQVGDSRTENLAKLKDLECEKWLIRMPMISRAEETVTYADVSLNSELDTIKALEQACFKLGKKHKIVLMYDLGDIREGYLDRDEIRQAADYVKSSPVLELYGIGTNMTCFSFVHPDTEKLQLLVDVAADIGADMYISGGNSATIDLMLKGGIPKKVNLIRLGEAVLFGHERAFYKYLDNTYNDAFILESEIIELKDKPSMPWGTFGVDSYGRSPTFTDKGIRKKAICALGKQDTDVETMWPVDQGIEILGASSDHLMLDITDSKTDYRVGDIIQMRLGYFALMRACTSPYIEREYL